MTTQVAVYVRVSTLNQVQDQTIEQQLQRLQAHIATQGWNLQDEHIFRDEGRSGATLDRPGLDKLRDVVRWGEVERLLITSPDRLARNYVHQMILLDELTRFGCQVDFLERPMSEDPHDRLLLQIRSAVAEYERTLITDRMRRGRLAKYKAGTLLPWTRPPYGYRLGPDRPRDPAGVWIEESEAAVVREIFALYTQESYSLQGLATHLQKQGVLTPTSKKIWSLATLRGILRQPAYLGQVYARRRRYRPARIRRSATHPIGQPHDTAEELPPEEWIPVAAIPALSAKNSLTWPRPDWLKTKASPNGTIHLTTICCGLWSVAACVYHPVPPANSKAVKPTMFALPRPIPFVAVKKKSVHRVSAQLNNLTIWSGKTCATLPHTRRVSSKLWNEPTAGTGCLKNYRPAGKACAEGVFRLSNSWNA